MTTTEKVAELILKAKKGKLAKEEVTAEAVLRDDLKFDSLGMTELLVLTEDCFKLQFSIKEALSVKTVGEMVALIDARLAAA